MQWLSQRDYRWAANFIGATRLTIGRMGCTLTCMAMLSDWFKGYLNPAQIAAKKDWFNMFGLIIWSKLNFPTMKFVYRYYERRDQVIRDAIKDPNKGVILEVANKSHWVLAVGVYGSSYYAIDPWTGTKIDVIARYGNITGCAVFAKK